MRTFRGCRMVGETDRFTFNGFSGYDELRSAGDLRTLGRRIFRRPDSLAVACPPDSRPADLIANETITVETEFGTRNGLSYAHNLERGW